MRLHGPWSVGLLGRLLAILLLTLSVEFTVSTFLYERSSRALIRNDEAHRLAEHLAIARRLLSERPWPERPALADRLTTDRYTLHWSGTADPRAAVPAEHGAERARVLEWEPSLAGSDLRVRLTPVGREARLFGALRLTDGTWLRFQASEADDEAPQPGWRRILLALVPAGLLLVLGALLFRRALRPMRMLADAADRVGREAVPTLAEAGPGEVRRVIHAFNAMQTRIAQLIADRTQALAAVGHDLRTPLARLRLRAELVADDSLRSPMQADVGEMEAMVGSLLAYLGGDDDPERPVRADVAVLAATIADDAADRGADAIYHGADHLEATVRPLELKRAIVNLVENALHYGGATRVAVLADGGRLVMRVDDDGPGIPEDRLAHVVEPFARLDPARSRNTSGLGLGLAIVARAAENGGGTLVLANRPEGGLRAELRLPLD